MTDFWTADRIETLRVMRAAGARVRDMMVALGATRNAVVGKLDRLGLTTRTRPTFWTPERCAAVKQMHAQGLSYPVIADIIGGTTARGVEKIVTKLGLPKRAYHHRPPQLRSKPRLVVPLAEPSKDLATSILYVTGCRWAITGHDVGKSDHRFCNHPQDLNSPYCPYHAEMNREKPAKKQGYFVIRRKAA